MRTILERLAVCAALSLIGSPATAGPCTAAIDAAQERADAQIEAAAKAGPAGPESRGAKLHHQPTPRSIAEAEARLGGGQSLVDAVNALADARVADAKGDKSSCEAALARVNQSLAARTEKQ